MIDTPNPECSDENCNESGYYERWLDDGVTGKRYFIYLCTSHREEFDRCHPKVYFKKEE